MVENTFESEGVTPPTEGGDHCEMCGIALHYSGKGRHPRFCAEHKPGAQSGGDGRKRSGKRKATESEWNSFLAIFILAASYIPARYAAGGTGIILNCPPGEDLAQFESYTETLSMQPEEAAPIAAYLAKRATPSTLNKKVGWLVVQSLELEQVGEALWQYGKRITPAVTARAAHRTAPPTTGKASSDTNRQNPVPDNAAIVAAYRQTHPEQAT
jgi:hypothetical protein